MTEPTDNDLDALILQHWPAAATATLPLRWIRTAFREGLAKWGTPPAVAGEPVAFLVCTEEGDPDMVFLNRHEAQQYLEDHEQPIPLYTTPQPTPTVPPAGREPLTGEQWQRITDLTGGRILTQAVKDEIERVISIKGGRHG